jgi:hypothetical protein
VTRTLRVSPLLALTLASEALSGHDRRADDAAQVFEGGGHDLDPAGFGF